MCLPELLHLVEAALPDLGDGVSVCVVDHTSPSGGFVTLSDKLEQVSDAALEPPPRADLQSGFLIVFTSGTTGMVAPQTFWSMDGQTGRTSQS